MKGALARSDAELEALMFAAWRGAFMGRVQPKSFPKTFDDVMGRKPEKRQQSAAEIEAILRAWR